MKKNNKESHRQYRYISTILFVLLFVGYPLVTTIFLPSMNEVDMDSSLNVISRAVTLPYRLIILAMSVYLILFYNWSKIKLSISMKMYIVFWMLLLIRMFYDIFVRTDLGISHSDAVDTWTYAFAICLIPSIAIIRSFGSIDFHLAFRLLFIGYLLLIPLYAINNPALFSMTITSSMRMSGNVALNTIAFGHTGVTIALLSLYAWQHSKSKWSIVFLISLLLGIMIALRSGSRGPFVALIVCFVLYYLSPKKNALVSFVGFLFIATFIYLLKDSVFSFLSEIAPVLSERMTSSDSVQDLSNGRTNLYAIALNGFFENPIFGSFFAIVMDGGTLYYSHNAVLDAFMGLGIIGGILFVAIYVSAFKKCIFLIKSRNTIYWLSLLVMQQLIASLFSGNFYKSDVLNVCLVSIFMLGSLTSTNKSFSR